MKPFEHTGSSANIDFYAQTHPLGVDYWWCEVLRSSLRQAASGRWEAACPVYYFALRRHGTEIEHRFQYAPKSRPRVERLTGGRVTQLVRQYLSEPKAAA